MRTSMLSPLMPALLILALAGCETVGPTWSELSGARYHRAIADRQALKVAQVDGYDKFGQRPVKVEPGRHEVTVESFRHGKFRGGWYETMMLDLAPCKRYYVNAQYPDPIQPTYVAVIDEVEDIAGCRLPQ